MNDTKKYVDNFFAGIKVSVPPNRINLFVEFINDAVIDKAVKQILDNQKMLMDTWRLKSRIADIFEQTVTIPNGTVGKPYQAPIGAKQLKWNDVKTFDITGLEAMGLLYDKDAAVVYGTPAISGDIKCTLLFSLQGEPEGTAIHEKPITIIINPDPKSLWKNLPSDKADKYWKEDDVVVTAALGNKHLVAASKRGRSHANVGSFRDDDFGYKHFDNTGWSIVAVADGAGSAKLSRQGAKIACDAIVEYFTEHLSAKMDGEFQEILNGYTSEPTETNQKAISQFGYSLLSGAAMYAHTSLSDASIKAQAAPKDFHTTLIFTLIKAHPGGFVIFSFGVGDCPIAVLNKDLTEVTMMNWLDVGEFGGGTRFITMPEIFKSDKFATRFRCKLVNDFSYLFMMTDGIYDAKFVVEANLEKIDKWKAFINDLQGLNADNISVQLDQANNELPRQLSAWMDFWSPGNHDDRTLVIVF